MAHNKIVLVTIHQPTLEALPDVFEGAAARQRRAHGLLRHADARCWQYFAAAEHEQHFGTELGGCPACGTTRPEFIFDVLETPLRDLSGDVIYEENTQGQLVPARRFSPDYWRDKYESFRLLQEMKQVNLRKPPPAPAAAADGAAAAPAAQPIRWRDEWTQFRTLLRRAFIVEGAQPRQPLHHRCSSRRRSRRSSAGRSISPTTSPGKYDFASAFHIPTYIFIALLRRACSSR